MTDAELADLERICDDDEDASISTHQAVTRLIAELRLARTLRVCSNCKLVGRHVESCNVCGGTEFEVHRAELISGRSESKSWR